MRFFNIKQHRNRIPHEEQQRTFEAWVTDHKTVLFKIVRAYAFTPADRDDLFQEMLVEVWRSVVSFKKQCAVSTWMYRVALNTAMKWNRQESRRVGNEPLEREGQLLIANSAETDERLEWLYEQIAKLNKADRSLALLLLDGFSYKEMATIVGISVNHVGVKINRIKKHLIAQSETMEYAS